MPAYARNFSMHVVWASALPKRRVDNRTSRFGWSVVMIDSRLLSVISCRTPGKDIPIDPRESHGSKRGTKTSRNSVIVSSEFGAATLCASVRRPVHRQLLSMEADEHTGKVTRAGKDFRARHLLMPTVVLQATNEQTSNPREGGEVSTIQGRRVALRGRRGSPRLSKSRACYPLRRGAGS